MAEPFRPLRRLVEYVLPPPIEGAVGMGEFLAGQANYLVQRATYEFCRNTLGYFGQWAWADAAFLDALRICRWDGFAAVLSDLLVVAEGMLRSDDADRGEAVGRGLIDLYTRSLGQQLEPTHRGDGFASLIDDFAGRLARARLAPPGAVAACARHGAEVIYATIPAKSGQPAMDYLGIERAVTLGEISAIDQLRRRLRVEPVRVELMGGIGRAGRG